MSKTDACNECGGQLTCTDSTGAIKNGKFSETYECVSCEATGMVTGEASEPWTWDYTGDDNAE